MEITHMVDQLTLQQHRDLAKKIYLTVWRMFNQFFVHLDHKPKAWKDRLMLFIGYLIQNNKQSFTVKSYISAVKVVFKMNGIKITED